MTDYPKGHQCRFCAFAFESDVYFCGAHEKCLSESGIYRENKCPEFAESDLGDFRTGKMYAPRSRVKRILDGQQTMFQNEGG